MVIIFFNPRISFLTTLGFPISFFSVFIVMDIMGISLNRISMFGLILFIGLLGDDSIIVIEQFYQYYEKGYFKFFMTCIFGKFIYPYL